MSLYKEHGLKGFKDFFKHYLFMFLVFIGILLLFGISIGIPLIIVLLLTEGFILYGVLFSIFFVFIWFPFLCYFIFETD